MTFREKIVLIAGCMLLFLMLGMSVFGDKGFLDLIRLKEKHHLLLEKNEKLTLENKALMIEINRLNNDLEYIGSLARRELGLVSQDEFIIKSRREAK